MYIYHTYTHILFTYIYLWRRRERRNTKNILLKEFPGGLVVNILGFHSCALGSTPGQGTEILWATCPGKKKKKKEYPFFHFYPNRQVFYVTYFPTVSSPETFFLSSPHYSLPIIKASLIFLLHLVPLVGNPGNQYEGKEFEVNTFISLLKIWLPLVFSNLCLPSWCNGWGW